MGKPDPKEVARAQKLHQMRGTGNPYRKVAVEKKLKQIHPDVHAAAKAHTDAAPKGGGHSRVGATPSEGAQYLLDNGIGPLPDIPGVMLGGTMSLDAKQLLEKIADAEQRRIDLKDKVDALHKQEDVELPNLLKKVKAASADLGRRAKDPELRHTIEAYTQAGPDLRSHAKMMSGAYQKFMGAAKLLEVAHGQRNKTSAEKDAQKAKAELDELQAKKQELRERLGKVVGYAKEILKDPLDPGSYQSIISDASKYLEGEVLDFLAGDFYGPEIKKAQEAFDAAQKRVEDIKSKIEADQIDAATKELGGAKDDYSASREALLKSVREFQEKETDVFNKLTSMGGPVQDVAAAIASRDETADYAEEAKVLITPFHELCTSIEHEAHLLVAHYHSYQVELLKERKRLADDLESPVTREGRSLLDVQKIAESNETLVAKLEAEAKVQKGLSEKWRAYISGESYMHAYKELESELHRAVQYSG
jgi:hypothetical protein